MRVLTTILRTGVVAVAALASAAACGGANGAGGDAATAKCVTGQSSACTCPGGAAGGQVCSADGTFGPCVCGAIDATTADVAGEAPTEGDSGVDATADSPAYDAPGDAPLPSTLSGAVQKGPFVRGSSITVQELDGTLAPTGRTFQIATNDDVGDFDIPVNVTSPYVEIIGTGYYFDELTNQLSSGPVTLHALADLTNGGSVNVSVLTSMSEPLVRTLVKGGSSIAQATTQAESSILMALGFTASSLGATFTSVGLTGSGSPNGEALAASLIVEQYARSLGGSEVAQLSQLLGEVGAATTDSGGDATLGALHAALCTTIWAINPASVRSNLTAYYASLNASVEVPPFEQFLCGCGIMCGSTCVNYQADTANCGACGTACARGQSCQNGSCVCPTGGLVCSGACVNAQTDLNNCGGCGTTCATGATCRSGVCVCLPTGDQPCNGVCVDEQTDGNNCGACGTVCTVPGQVCLIGSCGCPAGGSICNGACASTQSDVNNCGTCGTVCTVAGQTCQGGHCACRAGESVCNGACVNTQTDVNNCGACGTMCTGPTGQSCQSGSCSSCPSGTTVCNGACVNTQTDASNCGACGAACTFPGQTCRSGVCGCWNYGSHNFCGSCNNWCPVGPGPTVCTDAGTCVCQAGLTYCSFGGCTILQSDPNNCGACGTVCSVSGQSCQAGVCVCPSSTPDACRATCVDLSSDIYNCGTCDTRCAPPHTSCISGICT